MSETNKRLPRVLVVDDQPDNLAVLVDALSGSYTVLVASNGVEALRLIGQQPPPELVLLDIMMPGLDGYEVCRRIKADPATRDIPVVFLTALSEERDEIRGLALGAVDFVHKPISVPLVQARVATHLKLADHVRALEEEARLREDLERMARYDLKDPLTLILIYPELLLRNPGLSEEEREMLADIRVAGLHMLGVVNRSLDLYKMETGRYRYQPVRRDLSVVVGRAVADLRLLAIDKDVGIECSLPPLQVDLDELIALSLFTGLIENAIEASPAGGVVAVEVGMDAGQALIQIANPGAVPAELRECFFDKYAIAGKADGTGLGNYSAYLIARTLGGEIGMETDDSWGTRLSVRLPLQTDAAE